MALENIQQKLQGMWLEIRQVDRLLINNLTIRDHNSSSSLLATLDGARGLDPKSLFFLSLSKAEIETLPRVLSLFMLASTLPFSNSDRLFPSVAAIVSRLTLIAS
jgi:hypothetical protein